MSEELRVKYLFVNLKYSTYVKLCLAIAVVWYSVVAVLFIVGRDSSVWILKNGWWVLLLLSLVGLGEACFAISKAKKESKNN